MASVKEYVNINLHIPIPLQITIPNCNIKIWNIRSLLYWFT